MIRSIDAALSSLLQVAGKEVRRSSLSLLPEEPSSLASTWCRSLLRVWLWTGPVEPRWCAWLIYRLFWTRSFPTTTTLHRHKIWAYLLDFGVPFVLSLTWEVWKLLLQTNIKSIIEASLLFLWYQSVTSSFALSSVSGSIKRTASNGRVLGMPPHGQRCLRLPSTPC